MSGTGLTERDLKKMREYVQTRSPDALTDGTTRTVITKSTVSKTPCADARQLALDGMTSSEVADELDGHDSTIRKHLRGDCSCPVDEPALTWDESREQWVPDPSEMEYGLGDEEPACEACDQNATGLFTEVRRNAQTRYKCAKCGHCFGGDGR